MLRKCGGTPSRSVRPGRMVALTSRVMPRFTSAIATSSDGISPRSASKTEQPGVISGPASASRGRDRTIAATTMTLPI